VACGMCKSLSNLHRWRPPSGTIATNDGSSRTPSPRTTNRAKYSSGCALTASRTFLPASVASSGSVISRMDAVAVSRSARKYRTCSGLELLRWYRYLFLSRSKPSTHLRALGRITDVELAANAPEVLTALVERVRDRIGL
jgi:hypothetical protein